MDSRSHRPAQQESGLLGLGGDSNDMRELREPSAGNARAHLAIEVFCYRLEGVCSAVLGAADGDALVFTGGIGENAAPVRERTVRAGGCGV